MGNTAGAGKKMKIPVHLQAAQVWVLISSSDSEITSWQYMRTAKEECHKPFTTQAHLLARVLELQTQILMYLIKLINQMFN